MPTERLRPPKWTNDQLEANRLRAIARFIDERGRDSTTAYRAAFARNEPAVRKLLEVSADLLRLDTATIADESELVEAARYMAGPPISEDDLETLTGGHLGGKRLDPETAGRVVDVLRSSLDPIRFPWVSENRPPSEHEREASIAWTAGMWAAEQLRTLRRLESSKRQEAAVGTLLQEARFKLHPRTKRIVALDELPRGMFMHEVVLAGTKCDVPIRLHDGRLLALECKVSNSAVNSVKRLVRETGGKARTWHDAFGQQVVTGAVLAGVYKLVNLRDAQENYGVAIFWEHDLTPLRQFVLGAT
jgi:hypothetical protein